MPGGISDSNPPPPTTTTTTTRSSAATYGGRTHFAGESDDGADGAELSSAQGLRRQLRKLRQRKPDMEHTR